MNQQFLFNISIQQLPILIVVLLDHILDLRVSHRRSDVFEELTELSFLLKCFPEELLESKVHLGDISSSFDLLDLVRSAVHFAVPSVHQEKNPDLSSGVLLEYFLNRNEILERLAHFKPSNMEMSVVEPVVDPVLGSVESFSLSNFIVVVGELEVHTS